MKLHRNHYPLITSYRRLADQGRSKSVLHFLIGLAIATVVVVGCWRGNVFACVFVTLGALLPGGFGLLMLFAPNPDAHTWGSAVVMASFVIGAGVWLPRYIRAEREG
jgi:hypothetical protein